MKPNAAKVVSDQRAQPANSLQEKKYNFTLALIIGTLGGFLIFTLVTQGFPIPENQKNLGFIYHYQNLVAGIIAATAASATVLAIFLQISQQEVHRQDDLKRKLSVYRAYIPDALSKLTFCMEQYFSYLEAILEDRETEEEPWNVSPEHIEVLKDSLEYLEGDTSKHILKTVIFYQIHRSRFLGRINNPRYETDISNLMYDTVLLHRYLIRIFEFGRGRDDEIEDRENTYAEMQSSIYQISGHEYRYDGHYTDLERLISDNHPIEG